MIFPFEDEEAELNEEEEEYLPRERGIDFATGQLNGKIVEGVDAVLVWTWMALKTPRFRHYVYSWDYGQEFDTLIGKGYPDAYIKAELQRMVEECLTVNPCIEGIDNFGYKKEGDKVIISFRILTDFGDKGVQMEV